VFTTSATPGDFLDSYTAHANVYIIKPVDLDEFDRVVAEIRNLLGHTVFAKKSVGQVADHFAELIGKLDRKPAIIGHSFGGLLTQISAGRGLSAASVAIGPAPFRGVLPCRARPEDRHVHREGPEALYQGRCADDFRN